MRFKSWQRLLIRKRPALDRARDLRHTICFFGYLAFKFSRLDCLVLLVPALLMVVLCALTWVLAFLSLRHLRRQYFGCSNFQH